MIPGALGVNQDGSSQEPSLCQMIPGDLGVNQGSVVWEDLGNVGFTLKPQSCV